MKRLIELIEFWETAEVKVSHYLGSSFEKNRRNTSLNVSRLQNDSRQCDQGSAFIALQGHQYHGLEFLQQVLQQGVKIVISDRPLGVEQFQILTQIDPQKHGSLTFLMVENLNNRLADFCHWFYDYPSSQLKIIGITGTNGKTSSAFYCAQLLEALGEKVALIGTLGSGPLASLKPGLNTTPDVVRLTHLLAEFVQQGQCWVVMEVSSHAIALGRVAGIEFATTAITQIGSDHLDFHQTQQAYIETKLRLFSDFKARTQVFNLADSNVATFVARGFVSDNGHKMARLEGVEGVGLYHSIPIADKESSEAIQIDAVLKALPETVALKVESQNLSVDGIDLTLVAKTFATAPQSYSVRVPLFGQFSIENLLCSLSVLQTQGWLLTELVSKLATLKPVPGRMQNIHQAPTVIVDFAHTADALENLLRSVVAHQMGRHNADLWLVFGCGGDRDASKRPKMAAVAEKLADKVMVTSDNPRFEQPEAIISDILQGFNDLSSVEVIVDRCQAIQTVLERAGQQDIVIIAGKGHEPYQEVAGQKFVYSDQAVVEQFYQRVHLE